MHSSTPSWASHAVSPSDAVSKISDHSRIFIHGAAATPLPLIDALCGRTDLERVHTYHLHLSGRSKLGSPEAPHIRPVSLFTGPFLREAVNAGRADYVPIFLSDIPGLFTSGSIPLDVAIVQVSPPNRHGFCSLGTSVDVARAAVDCAKIVIAEINEQMPRTFGNSSIPLSRITSFIHSNRPLISHDAKAPTRVEERIGELVAELVPNGATLQMGIGAIPDATLARLHQKHDLGVHTEMFSDHLVDLFQSGAITNRKKAVHPGRLVTSFVIGTKKVFDFVDDNQLVEFHGCDRTNDTSLIRRNDKVVAINSAIEVDLSGQVCADSMGHTIYSGIGGQVDFIRGAALSKHGRPIIALPSTAAKGTTSRIVATLKEGAGVVTSRGHVHWVVTEYGAVDLHGKSLRERAELLIGIAHPDFRAELTRQVNAVRHFSLS